MIIFCFSKGSFVLLWNNKTYSQWGRREKIYICPFYIVAEKKQLKKNEDIHSSNIMENSTWNILKFLSLFSLLQSVNYIYILKVKKIEEYKI